MATGIISEIVKARYNPHDKFDAKDIRHILLVTIASIPLTSMLIILCVVAIARLKAAGYLPFI